MQAAGALSRVIGWMCLSKQQLDDEQSVEGISLYKQLVSGEQSGWGLFCQNSR